MLRKSRADGAHDIVDIEDARDVEREFHLAEALVMEHELRAVRMDEDVRRAQVGFLLDGIRQMLAFCMCEHRRTGCIVDVDDSRLALLAALLRHMIEELRLREHVVLERLVVVEVILREIREDSRVKLDARYAVLVERVRRDFHDDVVHALVAHHRQRVLQLDDIRRRIVDWQHLILDHDLDRANESDLIACLAQDGARDVARRRLAVRARDAHDAHLARRVVVEVRHDRVERRLQLLDAQHRDALRHLDILARRHDGACARRDSLRDELVAVNVDARDADEERALLHLARIVLDARDDRIAISDDDSILQEICQLTDSFHCISSPRLRLRSCRRGPLPIINRIHASCKHKRSCSFDLQPLFHLIYFHAKNTSSSGPACQAGSPRLP